MSWSLFPTTHKSSHPLEVSDSLGPHHLPKSYLLHHIRMACFSFQGSASSIVHLMTVELSLPPSLSCSHPFPFLRQHLHPHSMLSNSPATLSGLMISFLLMVPEAASPSGPPSSRMSRTSAPVAITPERWGSTPEIKDQYLRKDLATIRGAGPLSLQLQVGAG